MIVILSFINKPTDCCIVLKEQEGQSSMPTTQNPPSVFEQVGPLVDDWENYLNRVAANLEQQNKHEDAKEHRKKESLFQQVTKSFMLTKATFLHDEEKVTFSLKIYKKKLIIVYYRSDRMELDLP